MSASAGEQHALVVALWLSSVVSRNLLLACAPEVERVRALLAQQDDSTVSIKDAKGQLDVKLDRRGYRLAVRLAVPANYPFELATWTLQRSSFHPRYEQTLTDSMAALLYDMEKPGYRWQSAAERRGAFLAAAQRAVRRRQRQAGGSSTADGADGDDDELAAEWAPSRNDLVDLVLKVFISSQCCLLANHPIAET